MRCSGSARAVSIRIGTCEELRSERAKSMPDSCGIITSRMRRSKVRLRMRARARGVDRGRHAEAMLVKIAGEQVADAAIVVDDQNMRRVIVRSAAAMSLDGRRYGHSSFPLPPS